jgi:3-phosphoshikimate 1-carboxyvinyltransferase
MNVRIKKGKLNGIVNVPSSKSLTHRAIIAASLASGTSHIKNINKSKDIEATIKAMRQLGASIIESNNELTIVGSYPLLKENVIDCNESGSTIRFLIPLALLQEKEVTFVGHNKLVDRPQDVYLDIFKEKGIEYHIDSNTHYLPLRVKGPLKSGIYTLRGDVSSQFITGLLYTLPLLDGDSEIRITTKLESKSYIDLTIDVLKTFGVSVLYKDNTYYVKGNQEYKACDYTVEGDFSQAAFWLASDMLGSTVKLSNMNPDSLQGDKEILDDISLIGGKVVYENNLYYVIKDDMKNVDIDVSNTPDLGPILTCLLTQARGKSTLYNAERLRIKECDRITCVKEELLKLGLDIEETNDSIIINGKKDVNGGIVDSHNDHRLVMSFAILATISKNDVVITNANAITKSYPHFFDDFIKLGGNVSYE